MLQMPITIWPEANGMGMSTIPLGGAIIVITTIQPPGSLRCLAYTIGGLQSQGLESNCFRGEMA